MDHLMETYKRLPVAFARGEGSWLVDTEGRRYLDALTGIAVCGLGHAHPRVTRAIAEQAGITGTPTVQLFLKKELRHTWRGVKARSEFRTTIESLLAVPT